MNPVRYGIIGLGNQGTHYAVSIFVKGRASNARVTALCDIDKAKIEAIKPKLPEEDDIKFFTDYREMLDSGLCDAVMIEVPHYLHPEMAIEAFSRGIHVICDKPAGVYTNQVKEMNAAAEKSKALFTMMFNQRTNCIYRKMREMIRDGAIGELQRVNWTITNWFRTQNYYDSGSWRATWDGEGGGVLINQCPHQIDLVQWIVGELPISVNGFCGYGKWHDIEVEDEVTAFFRYKNGATGVFITTTGEAPGVNRLEISGTRGMLVTEKDKLIFVENEVDSTEQIRYATGGFSAPKKTVIEVETDGENPQHAGIINNFTDAILGKEPLFVDGREGIAGVELMNAIELSGWKNGETVTLPVDGELYLSELNARRATSRAKTAKAVVAEDMSGTF